LAGTGIRWNPAESGGIQGKFRNSCPTGIPAKKSCDRGKNQKFLRPPPKPCSCEKIPPENTGKKEILRNPGRNVFFCPKNKFLKTGICNLGRHIPSPDNGPDGIPQIFTSVHG
jgi:hypothetical protein